MRVPLRWLQEYCAVDLEPSVMAERFSLAGASVESIEKLDHLSGIVAARVLEVGDVAGSDKLCRARVDAGPQGSFEVCAGVKNFSVGDVVPFAPPGAWVGSMKIGARKMAGVVSNGMLLSTRELGLGDDHSGIAVLSPEPSEGCDLVSLWGLNDLVFTFELTPNRPDLMSIYGIAREASVLFGVELRELHTVASSFGSTPGPSIEVLDAFACPRYLGCMVSGVAWKQSPLWVQARLVASGFRPIGNLVDATNYVLCLTGQPLHAFDSDRIDEGRIVVRRATSGEAMQTLDGVDRKLSADDLVIADASTPQALAGVMGGATSEVSSSTSNVLIESAYFASSVVSLTSRRLGLVSEASKRFERGSDPEAVAGAAALCAKLMVEWSGSGEISTATDVNSGFERPRIALRLARSEKLLGFPDASPLAAEILTGLGAEVTGDSTLLVTPPSFRPDLLREVDLIEEIARVVGFDSVASRLPTGQSGALTKHQNARRVLRDALIGFGLTEVTLNSLVSKKMVDEYARGAATHLPNAMSEQHAYLRPGLPAGLVAAVGRNAARGSRSVGIFEIGRVFSDRIEATIEAQPLHLGIALAGSAQATTWLEEPRDVDFWDLKGLLESLSALVGSAGFVFEPSDTDFLTRGRSARISVGGKALGWLGLLSSELARSTHVTPVLLAEINLDALLHEAGDAVVGLTPPRFPTVTRDLSFELDEKVSADELVGVVRLAAGELVEEVSVLSEFRGIGEGRRALAVRLVLRAPDRTLTDEEADEARNHAASKVGEKLSGVLR